MNIETLVETPVTEQPVEAPELTYEYQPTDERNRPIGGKQVIKYRTPDELAKKLEKANADLQRELRTLKKNQRLATVEARVPPDAPRFDTVEFRPRELSADERVRLSRDLSDPEKFDEASSTLFEATVGAKPEVLRGAINDLQMTNMKLQARTESEAFIAANPSYYKCPENAETLTSWMIQHNLRPIQSNFQLAFDTLSAAGLLLKAPSAPKDAPTQRSVVPPPTSLTRNQARDAGATRSASDEIVYEIVLKGRDGKPTGEKKVYKGLAAVDHMPAAEYKRRLQFEPGFREKVENLERGAQ